MANKAFGIITSAANYIHVEGMHDYRPIGAFSFVGRYRVVDFPLSNMSNSGIDRIQVYINSRPRSIIDHIGSGRHYNVNSKRGRIQLLFTESNTPGGLYDTDIEAMMENMEQIERMTNPYVVIAPSYMVYREDYSKLLEDHVASGADISLLYYKHSNAKEEYLNAGTLNLNRQKGVTSITRNLGDAKEKNIFMDTYIMSKELLIQLIKEAKAYSSLYTLSQIVSDKCAELDVRGVQHKGYFAAILSLKDYYNANRRLLSQKDAEDLFKPNWPIYTRTTDSCPTKYYECSDVRNSLVSNGCLIEGTVENSVIGRGVRIKKGAVVKNSIILAYTTIGENVRVENQIVDKWANITHVKEVVAPEGHPGYVKRNDTL